MLRGPQPLWGLLCQHIKGMATHNICIHPTLSNIRNYTNQMFLKRMLDNADIKMVGIVEREQLYVCKELVV